MNRINGFKQSIGRKCMALFLVMVMLVTSFSAEHIGKAADTAKKWGGYVYITIEKITLGQGCIVLPVKVPVYEDEKMDELFQRLFGDKLNITKSDYGDYISGFKDGGDVEGWKKTDDIPSAIRDAVAADEYSPVLSDRNVAGELNAYDYSASSGWMTSLNNKGTSMGMSSYAFGSGDYMYNDNDVIRFQFSVYGYGADTNTADPQWTTPLYDFPDKDRLIRLIADYRGDKENKKYKAAIDVLNKWNATADEVKYACDNLSTLNKSQLKAAMDGYVEQALKYMHSTLDGKTPAYNYEWSIMTLARGGFEDKALYTAYYKAIVDKLREVDSNRIADKADAVKKSTDNARVTLAMTAIGADAADIAGYNLIEPFADFEYAVKSGINGAVFTLLALDSDSYDIPEVKGIAEPTTRDKLIDYILDKRIADGGWNYSSNEKTSDPDMTSMAIYALARYEHSRNDVAEAIEDGLKALEKLQYDNGGYNSYGFNAESNAQVLTALSACGLNAIDTIRCVKQDVGVVNALLNYMKEDGSFSHSIEGETNAYASCQCTYALVAYKRCNDSEPSLYSMLDADIMYDEDEIAAYVKAAEPTTEPIVSPNPTDEPKATDNPVATETPTATETPKTTEEPKETEVPKATDIPKATDMPKATDTPKTTETPKATEVPKATDIPAASSTPAADTAKKSFTVNGLKYITSSASTVICKGISGKKSSKLVIPASVKKSGKTYKVTGIADKAFYGNKTVKKLTVGKNVKVIGKKAFEKCKKLNRIIIKSNKLTINKDAFKGIYKRAKIECSKSVEKIIKKSVKGITIVAK